RPAVRPADGRRGADRDGVRVARPRPPHGEGHLRARLRAPTRRGARLRARVRDHQSARRSLLRSARPARGAAGMSTRVLCPTRARPGAKYLLGADEFGRDILSRVIYGSRVALLVGVLSMAIALVGGLLLGTLAGFSGGWIDAVLMRAVEILLAFPYLLLALAIVAALGPGALNTTIAVGI